MSVDGPFGDLVVVERAGSLAGAQAGKLLADLGARVLKLEPAGADPARARTADWAWFNTSKSSVVLPPEPHEAAAVAARWAAAADVLIESSAPDPLPPVAVEAGSDGPWDHLVRVRISPFGAQGPYAAWRSTDICDQAVSGHLYLSGDPAREPLQGPADQAALAAGVFGAIGALAGVRVRRRTGRGQLVEVTHHEVMAALHQFTELKWTHGGEVLRRMGNRYAGPGSPIGMYRAGDGPLALTVATAAHMEVLLGITGLDHLLERPDVSSIYDVMVDDRILVPPLEDWLAERTVVEAVDLLQSVRLAAAPVLRMTQLLEDPHLAERAWWAGLAVDGRTVRAPGPPFRISGHGWRAEAAPEPGAGRAGRPDQPPDWGPEPGDGPPARRDRPPAQTRGTSNPADGAAPLAGVRVLDLTRVWAGPLAARILAELGADVVIVEAPWGRTSREVAESYVQASRFFPENRAAPTPWNRNGFINKFALGKRSVSLDIGDGEGRAAFERLVAAADVVIENYSPRVMPNFGLDQARLLTVNPSLVYVTMPGYGRSGPAQHYSAYGPVLDSHAGLSTLMGYPELDAWKCGIAWPDPVAGIHGALATLVALADRDADPERRGRVVEVAQFETAVTMIGNRLVEAQLTGHDPPLPGNRHSRWAPQGVYPCAGDDRWAAISVPDDRAWTALVDEAGLPASWAGWTEGERRAAHDEIDAALSAWTAGRDHRDVAVRLQAAGVPAAPVVDGAELVSDPHLAARDSFVELTHPDCGTHPWPRLPVRLDRTPAVLRRPAPLLGEHNREVLTGWAGLSAGELAALEARGVVATEPPG